MLLTNHTRSNKNARTNDAAAAAVLKTKTTDSAHSVSTGEPNLEPILDDRFALSWQQVVFAIPFIVLFIAASHARLSGAGTWKHVAQGNWILQQGHLPNSDPLLPLADGFPHTNATWLSDVILAGIARLGTHWLSTVSAIGLLTITLFWAATFYQQYRSKRIVLLSVGITVLSGRIMFGQADSRLFGLLCLACLGFMYRDRFLSDRLPLTKNSSPAKFWGTVLLFVMWANLDPSFIFGLLLLLCGWIECVFDRFSRRSGIKASLKRLVNDAEFRRATLLLQCCLLATLCNPDGIFLWFSFSAAKFNPLLLHSDQPLMIGSLNGVLTLAACGILFAAIWRSRRVSGTGLSFVLLAGFVACWHDQFIAWIVPATLFLALRAMPRRTSVRKRLSATQSDTLLRASNQSLKFAWSLVALLLVWVGFSLSPASDPLLAGETRSTDAILAAHVPTEVAPILASQQDGLIWAPWYWADWFISQQPQDRAALFVGSQLNSLPESARRDYLRISRADHDWQRLADKYAIRTIVLDKRVQRKFVADYLRNRGDWTISFENELAMILVREGV